MTTRGKKQQEKPVGSAPGAASVRRGIDRRSDNWSSRPVVFPGLRLWSARPGTVPESSLFPGRDLSKDFFRLVENDLLQILQCKGLETPVSSPSTMV
jgi:hypothetical protein